MLWVFFLKLNWGEETWRMVLLTSNTFICYHWGKTRTCLRFFPCLPSEHNLNAIYFVRCVLKHWARSFFSFLAISHIRLSETGYTFRTSLRLCCCFLQLQLFQDHSFFLKNYSSSYNVKELENWYEFLVLVCCINFNAREFPLNLTAFFHNLHRNFRNYSPVLLPFTTCAHSYILPFYHHPLRAFLLSI